MRIIAFISMLGGVVVVQPARALDAIQSGLWEISIQASLGGQPMTEQPMTLRQCITSETAAELMAQLTSGGGCQISDYRQEGNRVRWNMTCTGLAEVSGSGEVTISDANLSGSMQLVVTMSGQQVPMAQNFEAHRVGDCR